MSKKLSKIIGLNLQKFDEIVAKGDEFHIQKARLLPFYKAGDEMALTSIFLSGVRLIREFRNEIFRTINLSRSNHLRIYTEVEFLLFDKKRMDGLILVVRSNKIVDAVLLEVKNNRNDLDENQISEYLKIAKEYGISKFLTISNQFVAFTTQSPTNIKPPKHVTLYHLSWTFILTIANILIADNETNIEDVDQLEVMREIVAYFESNKSGILGLTQMKPGWVELTQKANAGTVLKPSETFVEETVSSWLQEERCMALVLSKELGLFVRIGKRQFKEDLSGRIKFEKKELVNSYRLESNLHIDGAASSLKISAYFDRMTIAFSSHLSAPEDKKNRGKVSWLKNQLKICEKRNHQLYNLLKTDLIIDVDIKHAKNNLRFGIDELDNSTDQVGNREITGFSILYLKSLGKKFESRKGVVEIMEKMLINYYECIFQHLKRWEKPAPQIIHPKEESLISDIE